MYGRILVTTDGSELANTAVATGARLAKALGAHLMIVCVTEPLPPLDAAAQAELGASNPFGQYEAMAARSAEKTLSAAERIAGDLGVAAETIHVKDSYPAAGILEAAATHDADLIVIASHGRRGLRKLLLGSVTNEVLVESTIPVLVCR